MVCSDDTHDSEVAADIETGTEKKIVIFKLLQFGT